MLFHVQLRQHQGLVRTRWNNVLIQDWMENTLQRELQRYVHSLLLCVHYLWYKNPHFSNWLLQFEVISINKSALVATNLWNTKPSAIIFPFVVDAASGSGGSLCSIRIWIQTKHEHRSQGIVSSSCKCTISASWCPWYIFKCLTTCTTENPCKETLFIFGMPFLRIIYLS